MIAFRTKTRQRVNGKGGRWLRTSLTIPTDMVFDQKIERDQEFMVLLVNRDEETSYEKIKEIIDEMRRFCELSDEVEKMKGSFMKGELNGN